MLLFVIGALILCYAAVSSAGHSSCRFATKYSCKDFQNPQVVDEYLSNVMHWEGQFAQPGIAYNAKSGYTYDGHPIEYSTGNLYGEPHTFSAPSKESIHLGLLALALEGNKHALEFTGGFDKTIELLQTKIAGYIQFNQSYPGFGCFTPWVGFNAETGAIEPLDSWANRVPGLDNGEWFWSIYAISFLLNEKYATKYPELAQQWESFANCQKANAKTIFYRGNGTVSAVVTIKDVKAAPTPSNYLQEGDGVLNDPYEGETMTQMLYLFSDWESNEEKETLWTKKQGLFEKVDYIIPTEFQRKEWGQNVITVQKG